MERPVVHGQKNLVARKLCQAQQFAILITLESRPFGGMACVVLEMVAATGRPALVEQDFQAILANSGSRFLECFEWPSRG